MNSSVKKVLRILPDQAYINLKYFYHFKKLPNLKNPQTFNEKLQWLKLHDRKDIYTKMVDKYEAKKYVGELLGEEYIVPNYGVWDSFDDINFDELPNQFVLKCTHDCGGLVICRDKAKLDIEAARVKINKCLKTNYFWECREWPYKNVKPRIIAEKYMAEDFNNGLIDYKFYCFGGKVKFLYVSEGLENHETAKISFLTPDWEFADFGRLDYESHSKLPEKPKNYKKMIEIAEALSKDNAFLRVDLYEVEEKIYFSELTLTPASGLMPFNPSIWDKKLGDLVHLPKKND